MLTVKDQTEVQRKSNAVYAWKEVGLDLKVKVLPFEAQRMRLQYSFVMSNPSGREGSPIHRNRLESEIELPLDQATIVGGIQLKSYGDQKSAIPLLDSLPIVGPIFNLKSRSEMETNLYLHFLLKRAQSVASGDARG